MVREQPPFVRADALTCDNARLSQEHDLSSPIDFPSVDIEEPGDRFAALRRILVSRHLFKVITVEHTGRNHIEAECEPQDRLLDALGYDWIFTTCMGLSQTTRPRIT